MNGADSCDKCGTPDPFEPGTRVEYRHGRAVGTVVRHAGRAGGGGTRRILVRWDATPVASTRETFVSSYNISRIGEYSARGGKVLPW